MRLVVLSSQTLAPEDADVLAIVCKKREYLAKLITDIGSLSPALIAIDLYPQSASCKEDNELGNAVTDVSKTIPIVFASHAKTLEELIDHKDPDVEALKKAGFSDKNLLLDARLPLGGRWLQSAPSRLSCDTRAVPLSWNVYADKEAVLKGKPQSMVPFAYETSSTYDVELRKIVDEFLRVHNRAVISFLPEAAFLSIKPSDILRCIQSGDLKCADDLRLKVRGKIVLIGEFSDSDQHNSVIETKKVPGYLLQANYAEGLLDDRFSSPLAAWVELLLAVLGILVIAMIFELSEKWRALPKPLRPISGFVSAYVFIGLMFVACSAWRLYFGVEADFWAPLVPLPVVELVYSWRVTTRPEPKEEQHTHRLGGEDD